MEKDIFTPYKELHSKSIELVKMFKHLGKKDTRRNLVELISSQIATSNITLNIVFDCYKNQNEKFKGLLNNDLKTIENYIHVFKQSILESIIDTLIFQTELAFRTFYGKLTNSSPSNEKNVNKIIANLYNDTENSWKKDSARIIVLFWTMRNTIHTGGIYFKNQNGYIIEYKSREYKFEYGKSFHFLDDNHIFDLIQDFLDSLGELLTSEKITKLGEVEHPSHFALLKN